MGFDDIVNKGKETAQDGVAKAKDVFEKNKDKIDDAVHSEKAEEISDKVLDGVSGFAKKILPDSVDAKIDDVRNNIDKNIGNE